MSKTAVIIPARLNSSRFPRKLLQPVPSASGTKPLIQMTYEAASRAFPGEDNVFVATDNREIADAVRAFGSRFLLTGENENGTKRVAEAARQLPDEYDTIINVQGDEPEIDPALIWQVGEFCKEKTISTASCPILTEAEFLSRDVVKVVINVWGTALYFSRSPIPYGGLAAFDEPRKSGKPPSLWLNRHIGIYGFKRDDLVLATSMKPVTIEKWESLEQLSWMIWGWQIRVVQTDSPHHGIDTHADYTGLVSRLHKAQAAGDAAAPPPDTVG